LESRPRESTFFLLLLLLRFFLPLTQIVELAERRRRSRSLDPSQPNEQLWRNGEVKSLFSNYSPNSTVAPSAPTGVDCSKGEGNRSVPSLDSRDEGEVEVVVAAAEVENSRDEEKKGESEGSFVAVAVAAAVVDVAVKDGKVHSSRRES
jgi:hypothetical protein